MLKPKWEELYYNNITSSTKIIEDNEITICNTCKNSYNSKLCKAKAYNHPIYQHADAVAEVCGYLIDYNFEDCCDLKTDIRLNTRNCYKYDEDITTSKKVGRWIKKLFKQGE